MMSDSAINWKVQMNSKKSRIVGMIALAGFLLICIWIVVTPCPATLRPWNKPGYIESIWPPATSATMLSCSTKKIYSFEGETEVGVIINTSSIWELEIPQSNKKDLPSFIPDATFPDRVSLYVDGEEMPVTRQEESGGTYFIEDTELDLAGWYFLGSSHPILQGNHVAKVVIVTQSGKILEYEWHFIK
jgi:hypothetical protein